MKFNFLVICISIFALFSCNISSEKKIDELSIIIISSDISIGENVDYQPCGGTHVKNTSEINLIKKVKVENKGRMNKRIILDFNH